ncbi:peptidoglycan DD-metalloendopeptidase family protein [Candidatus Daviesbacteria bacterium]|nr:peptidoglycan DD-metalloendopeptidase family protein [Candidatus Daviesbacteria bacterium]
MAKLLVGTAIIASIVIAVVVIFPKKGEYDAPRPKNDSAFNDTSEKPPFKLKGVGLNLDDIDFSVVKDQKIPFEGYGAWVEVPGEKPYRNPQPTFVVPKKTKVRAMIDGFVIDVPKLYSGDYSVRIATSMDSRWSVETEHVDNPIVKTGDFVKAGQVVAEASTAKTGNNSPWAWFEIGIGKGTQNLDERPDHVCTFKYLDDSIKAETYKKLKSIMADWEEYKQDPNVYDENITSIPGCLTEEVIDG